MTLVNYKIVNYIYFFVITYGNVSLWLWKSLENSGHFFLLICGHPIQCLIIYNLAASEPAVKVKVKFSHTRYRALGPELIPVYRQSARR